MLRPYYIYWPSGVWMDGATYGSVRLAEREREKRDPAPHSLACLLDSGVDAKKRRKAGCAPPYPRRANIARFHLSIRSRAPPTLCTRIDNEINDVLDPSI